MMAAMLILLIVAVLLLALRPMSVVGIVSALFRAFVAVLTFQLLLAVVAVVLCWIFFWPVLRLILS
jgi:hypothetical protein